MKIFIIMSMSLLTQKNNISHLQTAMSTDLWFNSCDPSLQNYMLQESRIVNLKKGEYLYKNGDEGEGVYCILSGRLEVGINSDGKKQILTHYHPYEWIGVITLIDANVNAGDCKAVSESSLAFITNASLHIWLENNPKHWRDFSKLVCWRLRSVADSLREARFSKLSRQVLGVLFKLSFSNGTASTPRKRIFATHEMLSQMLGASRPGITIALETLANQGYVELGYNEILLKVLPDMPMADFFDKDQAE